jgi:signal transduction histidine kinase
MNKFPSSIHQKIILGYVLSFAVIVAGAVFTYINLNIIENRIIFRNVVSEFFDTVLEIRRFEKNYFLYKKDDDYRETLSFVNKGEDLIEKNKDEFKKLISADSVADLQSKLQEYKELIQENFLLNQDRTTDFVLEGKIRQKGRDIVTIAEDVSKIVQGNIQRLLLTLHRTLITATVSLIIIGVVFGYVLLWTVTKPLRQLQRSMDKISSGEMEKVSIDSSDGEIISLSAAFNRMLEELGLRQRQLVQSEKLASLGTLLSGIAHELNNPLSNISTSFQILNEEIESADIGYKKELLSQIGEQTDRARDIVRSILDFARPKELKNELLPLKDLINETIHFVHGEVSTNVEISVDVPDEIRIYADKQRIQQVFLNLIKNAIDAVSTKGAVAIIARTVTGTETVDFESHVFLAHQNIHLENDHEVKTIYIKIQDNGVGIEPEVVEKIFDPFFTTKDVGKGSGLGLFIVHSIIEEHGGSIDVKSQPGCGTAFLIQLPQRERGKGAFKDE